MDAGTRRLTLGSLAFFTAAFALEAVGQGPFVPNGQDLFVLDLAGTPVGGFPSGIQVLNGGMTVVDKDGQRMLRASSPSEFLIRFPRALPQDFTVEFDFIPKACCNPEDLALEGTPTISRGTASAHIVWHREILSVVGGGTYYQAAMPEDLKQATPGMRTQVVMMFEGNTVKLYTNGRRLYTLADRKFVRGGVLRVYLGGQDDDRHAVYLAGLRVAAGTGALGIVAATPGVPAQPTAPPGAASAPPQPPSQVTSQLPVVGPGVPNPQTASTSQASTGGPIPTVVANVTVTQGPNGPIVNWLAVAAPAVYTVQRWLVGNPACCNNTSPASPALTGPPWQDSPPPLSGTYVYQVTALTNAGTATGQTQFAYLSTGGGQIVAPAGAPSSGLRTVTTVPTTPTAPSAPVGASGGPVSTGFSVSVTMGASGPVVTWPLLTNATGYAVNRSKSDDPNCCNANSGRSWLVTSTWQDQTLPIMGSYLYIVTAVTPGGQVQAQTQFDFTQVGVTAPPAPISALPVAPQTGTITPTPALTVTVTMGPNGPVVSWTPVANATGYGASRSKIDDLNCCNNGSGRSWISSSPWQDQPLPMSGTYVYTVTANTPAGVIRGQTQFDFSAGVTPISALPPTTPTGTITPIAPPPPAPLPTPGPGPGGTPTVLNTGAAPTNLRVSGTPTSALVAWDVVPGAIRYLVNRAVAGTTTWTALGSNPNYPDTPDLRDFFPDRTKTYTYQVLAYQADGSYGAATVDFTPPAPTDPAGFTATQSGPGQVRFEWDLVSGVTQYLIAGPGTGNGISVVGQAPQRGTRTGYSLSGVPVGTHTWTIAAVWEPGGVLTPSNAWPKATATVSAAATGARYRLVALGFKALAQSKDINDQVDGRGDEVYFGAVVNQTRLTGLPLPVTTEANLSLVLSRSHGDQAVSVPYGRIRAGTASGTGGIKTGDLVPASLDLAVATTAPLQNEFPLLLWEGVLDAGMAVVVHPALWEDDVNPLVQAIWAKAIIDEARIGYQFAPGGTVGDATAREIYYLSTVQTAFKPIEGFLYSLGYNSGGRGSVLFECSSIPVDPVRRPCEAHGVDRPIGLGSGSPSIWAERIILLTRVAVEAALTARPSRLQFGPGTFVLPFVDFTALWNNPTEASAEYEVYLRVERVP